MIRGDGERRLQDQLGDEDDRLARSSARREQHVQTRRLNQDAEVNLAAALGRLRVRPARPGDGQDRRDERDRDR